MFCQRGRRLIRRYLGSIRRIDRHYLCEEEEGKAVVGGNGGQAGTRT